jgi:hypothetical protein
MNRLVRKFGKYNVATFIIMGVGVIFFLLAPTGWGVGFDSDVLGLFIFVIGLLMLIVGLIVRRVRSNFLKGIVVGIIAAVVICFIIGVVVYITSETPASVVTNDATEITDTQATLNGDLTDLGEAEPVYVSFQWGASSESYSNETEPRAAGNTGTFDYLLTGLTSNTTYYYRVKAVGDWKVYGDEKSFTTP